MDILFIDAKTRRLANLEQMTKKWSKKRRQLVKQRLAQLRGADCLDDMHHFAGAHLEELRYVKNAYHFTVRLDNPYRILFEPAHDPPPLHPGGNVDLTRVTAIRILAIGDTHGR